MLKGMEITDHCSDPLKVITCLFVKKQGRKEVQDWGLAVRRWCLWRSWGLAVRRWCLREIMWGLAVRGRCLWQSFVFWPVGLVRVEVMGTALFAAWEAHVSEKRG